jgi:hypothetical protein
VWWSYNQREYVRPKLHAHDAGILAGSDEFFFALDAAPLAPAEVVERVETTLLRVLAEPRTDGEHASAIVALAKLGDAPGETRVVDALAPFLAAPNRDVAETAALSFGLAGGDASIEWSLDLLHADAQAIERRGVAIGRRVPVRIRAFAAYALGLAARGAQLEKRYRIANELRDAARRNSLERSTEVGVACVLAFGLAPLPFDGRAAAAFAGALPSDAPVESRERQVLWLLAVLADRDQPELVRAHAPVSIARLLDDARESPWLRELAGAEMCARLDERAGESRTVRIGCAIALGSIGDSDDSDIDARIRDALTRGRDELHDAEFANLALISLARAAARPGSGATVFAATGRVREYLLGALARESAASRPWAALALGVLERALRDRSSGLLPLGLPALRDALDAARSPDEIAALATALGIAADSAAAPALRGKLVELADPDARADVALALGLCGDRASIEVLEIALRGAMFQPELATAAATALTLLDDERVVPMLACELGASQLTSTRASAAGALREISDARALSELGSELDDSTAQAFVRALAISAFGNIADASTTVWSAPLAVDVNYPASTPTLTSPDLGGVLDLR